MEYTVQRRVEYEPLGTFTTYLAINKRGKAVYGFERDDIMSLSGDIRYLTKKAKETNLEWKKAAIKAIIQDMKKTQK